MCFYSFITSYLTPNNVNKKNNARWSDHIFISNIDINMDMNTKYIMCQILIQKLPGELLMASITASSSLPA